MSYLGPGVLLTEADVDAWAESFEDELPTRPVPADPPTVKSVYQFVEDDEI